MFILCTVLGYFGVMWAIFYGESTYNKAKKLLAGPKFKDGNLPKLPAFRQAKEEMVAEISDKMLLRYVEENELFEEAAANIKKWKNKGCSNNEEKLYAAYWETVAEHQEFKKNREYVYWWRPRWVC